MKILIHAIHTKLLAHAACKFLQVFNVSTPYPPFVLSRNEYLGACDAGLMKYTRYFKPINKEYCLVMDTRAFKYSTDITRMRTAYSDFKAGWLACRGKKY